MDYICGLMGIGLGSPVMPRSRYNDRSPPMSRRLVDITQPKHLRNQSLKTLTQTRSGTDRLYSLCLRRSEASTDP